MIDSKPHITVEPVDVDGDGIIDVDMVTMYREVVDPKTGQKTLEVVGRKFIPHKKMQKLAKEVKQKVKQAKTKTPTKTSTPAKAQPTPKSFKLYDNVPLQPQQLPQNQPVVVQHQTGFGHYIKAGAGLEAGRIATDAVVSAISGLFGGGDEDDV